MRESGGRGQGPGRGAGGAGSQGGPGAARRTPGGPGRAGRDGSARSEGAGRPASPDDSPRKRPPDPFDLPFDDAARGRPPQDSGDDDERGGARRGPAGGSRGRQRRDDGDRGRSRDDDEGTRSRREPGDGPRRRPRDDSDRSRGRTGSQGRDDDDRPRGRTGSQGRDERARGSAPQERSRRRGDGPETPPGAGARSPRTRRDDAAPRRTQAGGPGPDQSRTSRTGQARGSRPDQSRTSRPDESRSSRSEARTSRTDQARGSRPEGPRGARPEQARGHERGVLRRGTETPPPRGPRRPPTPPRPPRPPLVLRLGSPRRRINIGLIGMTFVLSIFAGRLIQMQGLDSKVYEAAAVGQRQHVEEIPAKRGTITDVNGNALARTSEAREVSIDPSKIPEGARAGVAAYLARQLGKTVEEMTAKLSKSKSRYQLLARDVDPVVATRLMQQAEVPGLSSTKTYRRDYPAGDLAGSLIGFVGDEGNGLGGMEQAKNTMLAGRDGKQRVETGRDGQRIPMTSSERTAPVDGQDVRLTIDRDIQWAAQKSVADEVRRSGASSGAVIVMDVRTAQIIAMANAPELDLANWRRAPASSYVNKAAADVFEPGSTNKVITAAAALEAKEVTPDTVFQVPDNIKCADRVLRDAHPHKPEAMTFRQAMAQSSNVATIMAARKVGSERLYAMLKAFGFGATPPGGVPSAEAGLLPNYKNWSGSQSCTVAYGQGVSVTALQMASVYQTIANGGVRVDPQIVAGTTDATGRFVPAPAGRQTRVVSETTAKEIATMLETAVSAEGTGTLAAIPGYRVAGKTGTANRYDSELGRYDGYTASFVGFAPADAPRLVVLSVLQNPKNGHFGGQLAAPVFKDVMTFAIKSRKIPPTGSDVPPVRTRAGQ
ncbi:penicillin-binding transpeptidase domain-containing protein [Nonomuraea spiralis]|uniref:Penicillin-binding transpeptidase domain-containing protein n=1 Tax=Nonomuraea spiralis TaxID=46182 RepID=A0ABV5IZ90_9ACTN|nr:penicillin-binding transpeptidase domain-containing protein [Nonomuraea spiralis]